jgi:hypothetical protein
MRAGRDRDPSGCCRASRTPAYLAAALYAVGSWFPFVPDPPRYVVNDASVREDGWHFAGQGIGRTPGPATWLGVAIQRRSLDIELTVAAGATKQEGPADILTLSDGVGDENLIIGQRGVDLVVRIKLDPRSGRRYLDGRFPGALSSGEDVSMTLSVTDERIAATAQGFPGGSVDVDGTVLGAWDAEQRLTLGNHSGGARGWDGVISAARVTTDLGTTDLLSSTEVTAPSRYWILPDRLSATHDRPRWREASVAALHVMVGAGMVALWASYPTRRLLPVVGGFAVAAMVVNGGKVLIAGRHPSMATTLLQTGGGALAAAVLVAATPGRRIRRGRQDLPPTQP